MLLLSQSLHSWWYNYRWVPISSSDRALISLTVVDIFLFRCWCLNSSSATIDCSWPTYACSRFLYGIYTIDLDWWFCRVNLLNVSWFNCWQKGTAGGIQFGLWRAHCDNPAFSYFSGLDLNAAISLCIEFIHDVKSIWEWFGFLLVIMDQAYDMLLEFLVHFFHLTLSNHAGGWYFLSWLDCSNLLS